ncbi:MAG: glycoside hydrolase family 16 protein [Flavobacteriaceae bacterium]|nr:glycoside hydrolase family 16 protein [Flavobacteriaceae bacterium]
MKSLYKIIAVVALALVAVNCQEDDSTFGDVVAPTNLTASVDIANDQSGNVTLTPSADNVLTYHIFFEQGIDPVVITSGEQANYRYTQSGVYSQEIVVTAYGKGGVSSSISVVIDLDVRLEIDAAILANLAGNPNEGKRWIWDSTNAGHFGVGDPAETFPNFFSAGAGQLDPCLYDDVLTFSHDGQGNYTFELTTTEATFINWAEVKRFFPDATPVQFADECRFIDDQLDIITDFVVVPDNATGANILTVTNSTMSYWSGATSYEITELTENKLTIRGIQEPFDPPAAPLAWYHTFVPEGGTVPVDCGGSTGDAGSGNNDVLVWADEFEEDGTPCSDNWTFDIGTGDNGWGNGEFQYYTDRPENAEVTNGVLKITAKAESFQGSNYTSARLISFQKFDFTYGRVEARAKLPTGGGTWPAIWLLGSDFETNTWPGCGEIDIMEHVGNQQDIIFSSLHYPGNSGGNAATESINVPGVSDEFHIYAVEWTADEIQFSVDGNVYHTFSNNANLPFESDFFLILNVAMGGNFGGPIDPNFVESSMEIDYIRVYQ